MTFYFTYFQHRTDDTRAQLLWWLMLLGIEGISKCFYFLSFLETGFILGPKERVLGFLVVDQKL